MSRKKKVAAVEAAAPKIYYVISTRQKGPGKSRRQYHSENSSWVDSVEFARKFDTAEQAKEHSEQEGLEKTLLRGWGKPEYLELTDDPGVIKTPIDGEPPTPLPEV